MKIQFIKEQFKKRKQPFIPLSHLSLIRSAAWPVGKGFLQNTALMQSLMMYFSEAEPFKLKERVRVPMFKILDHLE